MNKHDFGETIKKILARSKEKEEKEAVKNILEKYGRTPDLGRIRYKEGRWIKDEETTRF